MKVMKMFVNVAALFWSVVLLTALCFAAESDPEYVYHASNVAQKDILRVAFGEEPLDSVTDLVSAEEAVKSRIEALKEEGLDLNDATLSNQVANFAEAVIARVATTVEDGGAVVVNKERVEREADDEPSLADRASQASEQIRALLSSEGFEESRPIRTTLTFKTQNETFQPVTAEIAADTMSTVADIVRIQTPTLALLVDIRKLESDFQNAANDSLRFMVCETEGSSDAPWAEVSIPQSGISSPVYLCMPLNGKDAESLTIRNMASEDSEKFVASYYDVSSDSLNGMIMESGLYAVASHKPAFSDIDGLPQEMREAIEKLSVKDIIRGYADGTFRPFNSVTRAHFVAFTLRTLGMDFDLHLPTKFKDVPTDSWCYHVVSNAQKMQLIEGLEPDFFGANYPINATQIYIVTGRVLNRCLYYPVPQDPLAVLRKAFTKGFEAYSVATQKWLATSTSRALVLEQPNKIFNGTVVLDRGNVAVVTSRLYDKVPVG